MRRALLLLGTLVLIAIMIVACGDDKDPVASTNRAPGQPIVDNTAGKPANNATGVSITPTVGWACTDPDNDALTYAVSFGTAAAPPVLVTSQTARTYSPASLAYSTKYYWSITAKDPDGETTSSAVWNFTTMAQPVETVSAPDAPSGPSVGVEIQNLSYIASGAISSFNDDLEYRFAWGNADTSDWGNATMANAWSSAGMFNVTVQARCVTHPTIVSAWSAATMVTITVFVAETISAPFAPDGPAEGLENEDLAYGTSGAISSYGDDVEYRFAWGDADTSGWSLNDIQHSWSSAGTYNVRAQSRCITHPSIVSDWSTATAVTISVYEPETVSAPNAPSGPADSVTNFLLNYTASGAESTYGHNLQYQFDWGDGNTSIWSLTTTVGHSWSAAGTYQVSVQARCNAHRDIESAWSPATTVTIAEAAAETVSPPNAPTAPATGERNTNLVVTNTNGAVSSEGHSLEYRFNFGDGDITNWFYNWITIQHAWAFAGTFDITMQARCQAHNTIVSAWSAATQIVISLPDEALTSLPGPITGVTAGAINEEYEYDCVHASATNLGDYMEGQYDWGDGTTSGWVQWQNRAQVHAWTTEGTYTVRYTARCSVHNDFIYESDSLVVVITTTVTETVSKPGSISANVYPTVGDTHDYFVFGSTSSLDHALEYQFNWGDGTTFSEWTAELAQVSHTWNIVGTFDLIRQARCIEHPSVVSEWSDPKTIYVRAVETVSPPTPPEGQTTADVRERLYYNLGGAISSHGHKPIEYRVYWDDGSVNTPWSTDTTMIYHRYQTSGEFEVKAQARCSYHPEIESEWSVATVVSVLEEVSTHDACQGPEAGAINISYTFFTREAATTSEGHDVEYQFDFDDGTVSDWSALMSADHIFTTAGYYYVNYRARCAVHTAAVSSVAYRIVVNITDDPEALSTGNIAFVNPSNIQIGEDVTLSVRSSVSNYGDSLEYMVEFGDGMVSEWVGGVYSIAFKWEAVFHHTYSALGTYDARCRSRCVQHPTVMSAWSAIKPVEVLETLAAMPAPTGPAGGTVGENLTFTTVGTTSDAGHDLEYSFQYFRYGAVQAQSDWSTSLTDTHVFTTPGDGIYRARVVARCIEHPNALVYSEYSDFFTITAK